MPRIVHGDTAHTRLSTAGLETPVEITRLEWRTGPGREDQPAFCTQSAPTAAFAAAWSFSRMRNAVTQMPGSGKVASELT